MGKAGARATARAAGFLDVYTKDVTRKDLARLFTRDTRDAYRAFAKTIDFDTLNTLPWPKRVVGHARAFLVAFSLKLSPARRVLYAIALATAVLGFLAFSGSVDIARHADDKSFSIQIQQNGAWYLVTSIVLFNLLVVLEVADRLSLKNDLDVARDIQLAMLPTETVHAVGAEVHGLTRPANTVGGDFFDIERLDDGRLLVAVGDVAGKGSPAALLMALLLAMLRVLLDEPTDLASLMTRLNTHIVRHAPGTRFITMFMASFDPATGDLVYVNAGHPPALLRHRDGSVDALAEGGVALGMFAGSQYGTFSTTLAPGDVLAIYSDGITEAEHPARGFFDENGLRRSLERGADLAPADLCRAVFADVEAHVDEARLSDDLTILVLRRPELAA